VSAAGGPGAGSIAGAGAGVLGLTGASDQIDFARLRAERRRRLFDAMAAGGVDVLVLGRPANVAYASGAQQLWTAGTRPFGPACLVVRSTGRVHLLSTWDAGVPPEIGHDELFGLSWNPAILASNLGAIAGLGDAAQVGTDGFSPGARQLLAALCPHAAVVDAAPVLSRARTPKTPDELACIVSAAGIAEAALSALVAALDPGVSERQLLGVYAEAIAGLGAPTPPTEAVVCATPRQGPVRLRRLATDRCLAPGELVVLNPGAFYAGYEGTLARTWVVGAMVPSPAQRRLAQRSRETLEAVLDACRAGTTGAELCRVWDSTGEAPPPEPFVRGVGLGAELPLIGHRVGQSAQLAAGTVLAVTAWVAVDGVGGVLEQDLVLVTDGEPARLTRYGRGPRA
jgi:Xaa-Pro aminopeptidase